MPQSLRGSLLRSTTTSTSLQILVCEKRIIDLSSELMSQIIDYEKLLQSNQNLVSPMARCSDDVLGYVLDFLIEGGSHFLYPLLLVNRRFHKLVMSSPFLWRKIFIRINDKITEVNSLSTLYIKTCQERSKLALMDIELDYQAIPYPEEFVKDRVHDALLAMVDRDSNKIPEGLYKTLDEADWYYKLELYRRRLLWVQEITGQLDTSRWRSGTIILPRDGSVIEATMQSLKRKMPHLQSLVLKVPDLEDQEWTLAEEFLVDLPAVKCLEIPPFIHTNDIVPNLAQLRSLSILQASDFDFCDLEALRGCRCLRELSIDCVTYTGNHLPTLDIELPLLTSLTLSGSVDVLQNIEFYTPNLVVWNIYCYPNYNIPDIQALHIKWTDDQPWLRGVDKMPFLKRLFSRSKKTASLVICIEKDKKVIFSKLLQMRADGELPKCLQTIEVVGVGSFSTKV
ncbi:hypothetical protein FRC17_000164 [Serendipita sp. 399]|nr:hypothetical protein FRC17_000164 [Serendipita sp. 399]